MIRIGTTKIILSNGFRNDLSKTYSNARMGINAQDKFRDKVKNFLHHLNWVFNHPEKFDPPWFDPRHLFDHKIAPNSWIAGSYSKFSV